MASPCSLGFSQHDSWIVKGNLPEGAYISRGRKLKVPDKLRVTSRTSCSSLLLCSICQSSLRAFLDSKCEETDYISYWRSVKVTFLQNRTWDGRYYSHLWTVRLLETLKKINDCLMP